MESKPLNITGICVNSDELLFSQIDLCLERNLPEIRRQEPARSGMIALVGSGPSIATQVDVIRMMKADGVPILAVRDSHDWLIAQGIIPDFALSVDPLETAAECFARPHPDVQYLIASQSHPKMFDNLKGAKCTIWHAYMQKGQKRPKKFLIGGSTTSGLRAVMVMYVLGWRDFALFGYDCCMSGENLRINSTGLKNDDVASPITLEPGGEEFWCNPNMTLQAQTFQDFYELLPDATFSAYGHGLIAAMIRKRAADKRSLDALLKVPDNGRVSFIHSGDRHWASYRYRAEIPAAEIGASINDLTASTLIFAKPKAEEIMEIGRARTRGQRVIVDFCDDHFDWVFYQEAVRLADAVTCPTVEMASRILKAPKWGRESIIIPDPYEFPLVEPHYRGYRCLWYGHSINAESLYRITGPHWPEEFPLRVVSNLENAIPWSHSTMLREFAYADIVVMPATAEYKSPNRTVEALRQGCFVLAEPHPSLMDIPGIWIGDLQEGLKWLKRQSMTEIQERTSLAASYVTEKYSPKIQAAAWRNLIQSLITSGRESASGRDGSMSVPEIMQT